MGSINFFGAGITPLDMLPFFTAVFAVYASITIIVAGALCKTAHLG